MSGLRTKWEGRSDSKEYKPLPQGDYHAAITGCSYDEVENKVSFEFTISDADYAKRKVWDNLSVDSFGWKIKKNFEAIKVWTNPDSTEELVSNCENALNKEVCVTVVQNAGKNGKIYNKVRDVKLLSEQDIPF